MSAISDTTENCILDLTLRAEAWANYADNAASSPEINIALALHTADPGDAGDMSTSEASYINYARGSVPRSTGWTAAVNGSSNLAANLDFPASGSSGETLTHFSTGKSGGGAAPILWYGAISPTMFIGTGTTPRLVTATSISIA